MKLQLVARHLRDDQDLVVEDAGVVDDVNVAILISHMEAEIEANRAEGANWRFSIQPIEETYK
ncbi:hypothetical protein [Mesorhizobium sp. WSM2239]|uniref:Uncharacterized protein n=2 Tax=unclassified Mesorhizobium TaxID=325217 RepID=A0AAU8D0Q2_9HYPH